MKINLGCGAKRFHMQGWVNVDNNPACEPDVVMDVGLPWDYFNVLFEDPNGHEWDSGPAEEIRADNVLEHLNNEEFMTCMNEAWRVLKPDGIFWLRVPNAKLWPDGAFGDPTHKRYFVDKSFQYWDVDCPTYRDYGSVYGFQPWRLVKNSDYSAPDPRGNVAKAFFEREYQPVK